MCPLCIGSAVMVASSVVSTGGLTALVVKTFGNAETGAKTTWSINKASGANDAPEKTGEKNGASESGITRRMA